MGRLFAFTICTAREGGRVSTRIIFMRHGQTDYNAAGRVQGQIDIALNEVGKSQVRAAAARVAQLKPDRIISSDLSRAVDTAQGVANLLDVPVEVDKRVRERAFGVFEGMSGAQMQADYGPWYSQWRSEGECADAGIESRRDVGERFAQAVLEASQTPGTYLFVSHGSAIVQAMTCLLGLDPHEWAGLRGPDNCHWSILVRGDRPPHWRLLAHNFGVGQLEG